MYVGQKYMFSLENITQNHLDAQKGEEITE